MSSPTTDQIRAAVEALDWLEGQIHPCDGALHVQDGIARRDRYEAIKEIRAALALLRPLLDAERAGTMKVPDGVLRVDTPNGKVTLPQGVYIILPTGDDS